MISEKHAGDGCPVAGGRSGLPIYFLRSPAVCVSLVVACLLFAATPLLAHINARYYRGDITVPTSWDGVIRLTGKVVIREGVTVTVDPGTEVLVQPGKSIDIVVQGRFLVRGLPGKPVVFDSAGGCSEGSWGGVVFAPGSSGILENAAIRCSSTGIRGSLSGVTQTGVVLAP